MRSVTTPNAPSPITRPSKSGVSSRDTVTRSPPGTTRRIARTLAARTRLPTPEPCVPVAHAPATEMCGNEPRFGSANPAASSRCVSSPYRTPPLTTTVAVAGSTSMIGGKPATVSRSPVVSAIRLNEWPLPSTRAWVAPATICWTSSTLSGRWNRSGWKVMLRAQFVGAVVTRTP